MDTDSSFPDTPRHGNEELEGAWPQQTFCQGGDNLQPADYVLLPLQGGYRLVTKHVVIPPVCTILDRFLGQPLELTWYNDRRTQKRLEKLAADKKPKSMARRRSASPVVQRSLHKSDSHKPWIRNSEFTESRLVLFVPEA